MRFRDRPIEQKIFLTILPMCLLPSLVFLALIIVGLRVTFQRAVGHEIERNAANIAGSFDTFVNQYGRRALAAHRLADAEMETTTTRMLAQGLMLIRGTTQSLQTSFTLRTDALAGYRAAIDADLDFQRDALQLAHHIPPEGMPLDHLIYATSGTAVRLVYFIVPQPGGADVLIDTPAHFMQRFLDTIAYQPETLFVFTSSLLPLEYGPYVPKDLSTAINRVLQSINPRRGWDAVNAGPQHLLIGIAESAAMRRASSGLSRPAAWTFVVPYDMESFLGPQETLIWLAVLIVLVLLLVLIGMAVFTARWIGAPLLQLRAGADALADGHLDAQVAIQSRDEVGRVAAAFNIMATRLKKSYASLEERLEENRLHTEHIYVLNQLTNAIIQALSLERIFEILCADLHKICTYDAVWIALLDRDEHDLAIAHIEPQGMIMQFERGRVPLGRSLHGRSVTTGETHHAEIGAGHHAEFFETRMLNAEGLQSFLIAPLPGREGVIGTLTVASSEPDAYHEEIASIMTSLANAVAVAIEQTALFQQITQLAAELERKVADRTAELRRATRKLLQTEKYFATGRMAGNLGHEINNPLGIIKNYLRIVRHELERSGGGRRKTDPNIANLNIIEEEVNRIARLVRNLLDLHRPVEHKIQPIDINIMLDEILALLHESLRRMHIEIVKDYDAQLPMPTASPDLIRQVLINLVRNAQDAIESAGANFERPGQLTLRTSTLSEWHDGHETQSVRIRVTDTGIGIPPEHLAEIFDPFFTTKPSEKGSGLGLSISYGIIQMYGGSIDVESKPGQGTSFVVTLPLRREGDPSDTHPPTLDPGPSILW